MQTKDEHLLILLMEEAGEAISALASLQKAASKALRFGLNEFNCENPETNNAIDLQRALESLNEELTDLEAIRFLLDKEGLLYSEPTRISNITLKLEKVQKYMDYSREVGILEKPHWCKDYEPDTTTSPQCSNSTCIDYTTCKISTFIKKEN